MLEGERQPAADDLDALLVGAALDARDAVQAQRAGAQVGAVGAHRLGRRELGGRRRLGVPAGALQVARASRGARPRPRRAGRWPRRPRRRRAARRAPARGRPAARRCRRSAARRRPARGPRRRAAGRDDLALGAGRLAEVARQLGVAGVALDDGQPLGAALALGPDVERLAAEPGGVAVGVDRRRGRDRLEQRLERARADRARRASGSPPAPGRRRGRAAPRRGGGGSRGGAATARRRRSPRGRAGGGRPRGRRRSRGSGRRRAARRARPRPPPSRRASRSNDVPTAAAVSATARARVGQRRRLHEHGVADRLRERDVAVERELGAVGAVASGARRPAAPR